MKKHLSVFSLLARESIYKIFLLWIFSFATQAIIFMIQIEKQLSAELPSIKNTFEGAFIHIIFFIFFVIMLLLLTKTGMQFSSKTGYTLRRLRISEKSVFLWQSLYNFIMVFLTLLFEIALCFILANAAANKLPSQFITHQSVYIAFYDCAFLQNLFAGVDTARIIRNIITVISLALNCAAFSYLIRRNKKLYSLIIVIALSFSIFAVSPQTISPFAAAGLAEDVFKIFLMLIMDVIAVSAVVLGREQYDE